MTRHLTRIVLGAALATLLLAVPAAASGATRFVRTTGNDANAATGCSTAGQACLTIGGAVNAPATTDGDTIDIGAGTFSAPGAAISETLSFVGNGPGIGGSPPAASDTVVDAGAGPQEALRLLKGGSVSNLRLKGATGGGFSEALVLGTNNAAATMSYTVSNVVAIGGVDPTLNAESALLVTDAGASGGTINATVTGYFEAGGAMPGFGPGVAGVTGTNVGVTLDDSTLRQTTGGIIPATVEGGASLTLTDTDVPEESSIIGVQSSGAGSELTVDRSTIEARETPVMVRDTPAGVPGDTSVRDSLLVARSASSAPESEHALSAFISGGSGTLDVDIDGSTLAAVGPNVESGLSAVAGTNSAVINVTASNSIFRATDTAAVPDGTARDIRATANLGAAAPATVTADHSSYSSVAQPNFGGVTPAGTGSNISGNPQFANELGFDFTLQASSPLVDAGAPGVSGPLDVAGNPREVDASCDGLAQPDIGAYERAANCPPPPQPPAPPPDQPSDPQPEPQPQPPASDGDPPETLTKKPKVKGDDVTIRFSSDEPGSTFECKLDKKPFKSCRSPKRYRNLDDGKHKVLVVAIDPAGNRDTSAAKRKFAIEG